MNIEKNPIELFTQWFNEQLEKSKDKIPTAVCLSTIGTDNFPNARFVSFKELIDDAFVITGPLDSRKGIEIQQNNSVALTFWWSETERQVRIQGQATQIEEALASKYFAERNINSKAVSLLCDQGKEVVDLKYLEQQIVDKVSENASILKPKNWGGFLIKPIRIEFMEFKETRFHHRLLFTKNHADWTLTQIQP